MKAQLEHYAHDLFASNHLLKSSIEQFEAIEQGEQLSGVLQEIASQSGYECLAFVDFMPMSTTVYDMNLYGHYHSALERHLDTPQMYSHFKSGIRISAMSNLLAHADELDHLYALPLRGVSGIVGGLVFNIPEDVAKQNSIESIDWYWTLLSPYLLNAALRCRTVRLSITKRERDCLLWASEGKTSWEISQILGITERTVNFHLTNCIEKTQSANRQQAIVKCIINNLI
ncbi:helix-turn-helix transcriptional regulator [Pseudoalteromonas rubra]|uniref:HTH luxR-type domain-containing protein n=2 Tax=Pseudoalteromonas TaxID=53246 RepID=A0A5S3WQ68_9GAMM|nr:helix-turn-helix transcriptional regulator [Pseudoalteromonas rubra]TMP30892.1 hypothetical protein CWB98_23055 [Pseudoalteromonas rubra]